MTTGTVRDHPNGTGPGATADRLPFGGIFGRRPRDDKTIEVFNLRLTGEAKPGTALLWCAAILLLGLAAAQGYVSFRAQYNFIYAAKGEHWPSVLEAIGLDTGAVIFALLGLAHARMGRKARIERILNVACALGSAVMNLLGADLASPRSVAVYVLPAVLYAACSDRLIATAAIASGTEPGSVWQFLGTALLYGLRALVAFPSTVRGLRWKLLAATPLPAPPPEALPKAPAQALLVAPAGEPTQANGQHRTTRRVVRPRRGESKKAVLLRLYADHPVHGDRAKASAVAAELAPLAKLQAGTARSYIYAALDGGG